MRHPILLVISVSSIGHGIEALVQTEDSLQYLLTMSVLILQSRTISMLFKSAIVTRVLVTILQNPPELVRYPLHTQNK